MLEQSLRKLFEQISAAEPPPGRVTVADVLRQGRLRRRRHRIGAVGAPVLAAAAVAAITLPLGIVGQKSPQASSYGNLVGGAFDPSYLAIKFGWLPRGTIVTSGETSPGAESLYAYAQSGAWNVAAYAPGVCHANIAGRRFRCLPAVWPTSATVSILRRGPVIDGHGSLWLHISAPAAPAGPPSLAWEYAPDAWVILDHQFGRAGAATAVRIARAVEYGQHIPFRFASRFTSLPRGWRIVALHFFADGDGTRRLPGVYFASGYKILRLRTISPETQVNMFDDTSPDVPILTVVPAIPGSQGCLFIGRSKTTVTIHGYRVTLADYQTGSHGHVRSDLQLCAEPVDDLSVAVDETGVGVRPHLALSPTQIVERLQLLGTRPSHWVTNPIP
jgi:hypothetical protein